MKKVSVFCGEQGLTETSANHIANLAKETLKKDEADIAAISFVHKQVSLINDKTRADVSLGLDESECRSIAEKLEHVMKVKSLIAWLREAIKEKKRLHDNVETEEYDAFLKEWSKTHEDKEKIEDALTEQTYVETLSIAERCKIFSLQTEAAIIGKAIHEKGALSKAREEMHNVKRAPSEIVKSGMNNLIYFYEPSLSEDVVDEVYFALQKKHRSIQAELNSYLYKQEEAIRQSQIEYSQKSAARAERKKNEDELMRHTWSELSKKRHREISSLKIIIPNQLRSIYEEIQNIG